VGAAVGGLAVILVDLCAPDWREQVHAIERIAMDEATPDDVRRQHRVFDRLVMWGNLPPAIYERWRTR